MHILVACGPLTLRITPFRSAKERWFVADAKVDLTFTNSGARPGVVDAVRLRADYPTVPMPKAHEFFSLNAEVDPKEYDRHADSRLSWANEAKIGEGAPFILLPRESQTKRLIFNVRWDEPVVSESIIFILQVYSQQSRRWKDHESWQADIGESLWVYLANEKGSMTFSPKSRSQMTHFDTVPGDLHEHTKPKNAIPDSSEWSEPTYMDYPRAAVSWKRRLFKWK
jgi:hypothetical protein